MLSELVWISYIPDEQCKCPLQCAGLETILWLGLQMSYDQISDEFAGPIGLLKQFVILYPIHSTEYKTASCSTTRFEFRTAREKAEGWTFGRIDSSWRCCPCLPDSMDHYYYPSITAVRCQWVSKIATVHLIICLKSLPEQKLCWEIWVLGKQSRECRRKFMPKGSSICAVNHQCDVHKCTYFYCHSHTKEKGRKIGQTAFTALGEWNRLTKRL